MHHRQGLRVKPVFEPESIAERLEYGEDKHRFEEKPGKIARGKPKPVTER